MTDRRIRGRTLQRRNRRILQNEPLCRRCADVGRIRAADVVDHIVALTNGGLDVEGNLQPLCTPCHDEKTREDMNWKPKPTIGEDGWPIE